MLDYLPFWSQLLLYRVSRLKTYNHLYQLSEMFMYEQCHKKTCLLQFAYAKRKAQINCVVTAW